MLRAARLAGGQFVHDLPLCVSTGWVVDVGKHVDTSLSAVVALRKYFCCHLLRGRWLRVIDTPQNCLAFHDC